MIPQGRRAAAAPDVGADGLGGAVLAMIDDTHAGLLLLRHAGRAGRAAAGVGGDDGRGRGPEAVARFPNAPQTGGYGYVADAGGIATLRIAGVMTPERYAWYDDGEAITDWVARDLAAMAGDPGVRGVLLSIDSPGGYVAGAFELADAVAALAAAKPVAAHAEGHCCSAAYMQAAAAGGRITAYKSALVGSIGTRTVVVDAKGFLDRHGIKVIPIDSGGMKSAGLIGTEVTAEQVEYFRGNVMQLQALFTRLVADGRGVPLERATAWADGRVHVAGPAVELGLIDGVATTAEARAALAAEAAATAAAGSVGERRRRHRQHDRGTRTNPDTRAEGGDAGVPRAQGAAADHTDGGPDMGSDSNGAAPAQHHSGHGTAGGDATTTTTAAGRVAAGVAAAGASLAELKAACPGAPSDFLVEQLERGSTAAQATAAFIQFQQAQIRSRDEQLARQRQQAAAAAAAATEVPVAPAAAGTSPVPESGVRAAGGGGGGGSGGRAGTGGDAVAEFDEAVREEMKLKGCGRKAAIAAVCRRDPELHRAMLEATNAHNPKARQSIADKFAA